MTSSLVDSTFIIHSLRHVPAAQAWLLTLNNLPSITAITWLEVMEGSNSKANQARNLATVNQFDIVYPNMIDFQWAMGQIQKFQFSHRIGMNDCLIAAVAHRLQVPLYTHNLKHMQPLLGSLAVKPY